MEAGTKKLVIPELTLKRLAALRRATVHLRLDRDTVESDVDREHLAAALEYLDALVDWDAERRANQRHRTGDPK